MVRTTAYAYDGLDVNDKESFTDVMLSLARKASQLMLRVADGLVMATRSVGSPMLLKM